MKLRSILAVALLAVAGSIGAHADDTVNIAEANNVKLEAVVGNGYIQVICVNEVQQQVQCTVSNVTLTINGRRVGFWSGPWTVNLNSPGDSIMATEQAGRWVDEGSIDVRATMNVK